MVELTAHANGVSKTARSTEIPFFQVSLLKLVVMSFCTFGIYEFYWFYRNWKLIKLRENVDIWPFWRAFFAVVSCYFCFKRIVEFGETRRVTTSVGAGPLAIGWIVFTVLGPYLPDSYWFVAFLAVFFMLPVQSLASRINKIVAPEHDLNDQIRGWNWLAIAFGALTVGLEILDAFFPAYFPELTIEP